jgi:hypothetical protein
VRGGQVGREPRGNLRGAPRIGIEQRLNPGEEAQRGVDELAVEFAITRTERAVRGEQRLHARRQVLVAAPVRAQRGEQAQENFLLTPGEAHLRQKPMASICTLKPEWLSRRGPE